MHLALRKLRLNAQLLKLLVGIVILAGGILGGYLLRQAWVPAAHDLLSSIWAAPAGEEEEEAAHDDHEQAHDDSHVGHDESTSLHLSPQARKNIGLSTTSIELQPFVRTVSMPGIVVERPGRSQIDVTAPLGGRVTRVYPIQGEAVLPGQPLFDLQLTHEELVNAQTRFLEAAEQLDVENREIKRLESVSIPGAIPGKTIRMHQYEKQKVEATLNAQRQSLMLHGMTQEQVKEILDQRKLIRGLTVYAPEHPPNGDDTDHPFHVQTLRVKPGQYVAAGAALCVLADHHALYIEGKAFEQDVDELSKVLTSGRPVSAALVSGGKQRERIEGLSIYYLSDTVDPGSRAFHFYLQLPNEIVRDAEDGGGHRFVTWRFRPGQRTDLRIPVETWDKRIVLPIDAVADEGAETFVFEQNGDHFDRTPVHVQYRDKNWAVIENDGRLLGAVVASSGAHQMQMALKNKAGGAPDPHAGHHH
jgi:cobalt-zinc-cadmium efflux system membrane fusion protein